MEEHKGHRKHSKEFKEEAIRLVVEGGRPVIDVAEVLVFTRICWASG